MAAAIDYGITAVELGGDREPQIPLALLAQARSAARNGVSIDTVLRRYFAGYSLLAHFIVEEAGRDGLMRNVQLQRLLGSQAVLLDRLLTAIGEEYSREYETLRVTSEERQAERIERLLDGELLDTSGIPYDFEGWHLGVVASGPDMAGRIRELAKFLDARILLVGRGDERRVWAWLGARGPLDPSAVLEATATHRSSRPEGFLAIGEPGLGLAGWRLTHRQALAGLLVAQRAGASPVRYGDAILLAAVLRDDLLADSLHELYILPLCSHRDDGEMAKETLRAYLAAGGNVSSAAAALKVKRHTVTRRLRGIEAQLGRPIESCRAEIETALRMEEISASEMAGRA